MARPGEGWASPGVLAYESLHDEHSQNKLVICNAPTAIVMEQVVVVVVIVVVVAGTDDDYFNS